MNVLLNTGAGWGYEMTPAELTKKDEFYSIYWKEYNTEKNGMFCTKLRNIILSASVFVWHTIHRIVGTNLHISIPLFYLNCIIIIRLSLQKLVFSPDNPVILLVQNIPNRKMRV